MPDRDKVISHFQDAIGASSKGNRWRFVRVDIIEDAIELLKEQEAVKPKLVGVNMWECGECDTLLGWEEFSQSGIDLINYKYCPGCGRKVKWDD